MNTIEFTGEELEILEQILKHSRDTLEIEIRHSSHREFRDQLKQRCEVIEGMIEKTRSVHPIAMPR